MTKIQKEVLAQIQTGGVFCASDWAFHANVGAWTKDKFMRRIDAVIALAQQGKIVDHETSAYHALTVTCRDCD